jgi:hypothetical protein
MTRKTARRRKSESSVPLEVPRETTASEPVQTEETQGIPDVSREKSVNMGREEHDPTPATPSVADSTRGADLSALRTPLRLATLSTYVESIRSMPTPYGLVSMLTQPPTDRIWSSTN